MSTTKIKKTILMAIPMCVLLFFVVSYNEERAINSASSSFREMHHDRLVAEQLIYKMSDLVHKKQLLYHQGDEGAEMMAQERLIAQRLRSLITIFSSTRLSAKEEVVFAQLSVRMETLVRVTGAENDRVPSAQRSILYNEILANLDDLSDIQVLEGKRLNDEAQATLADSIVGINLQSALFLIFLLSLVSLVRSTWVTSAIPQQHEMN